MGKLKTLGSIVEGLHVCLIGNRITAFGVLSLGASFVALSSGAEFPLPSDANFLDILKTTAVDSATIAGSFALGYSHLGFGTLELYNRTIGHIREHGKLEERYASTVFTSNSIDRVTGYCQIQGMYLAAAEEGFADEFRRYKEMYSNNIIPNF
ncbi:MAG: hypothetical protein EPN86_04450 [Nanoarchaeota archaeon]|nr:MAG: hypothetical protein EPN86_04450 [Nanoarchaeota archaeon]